MIERQKLRFNPNRLADALDESRYLTGLRGGALKPHREPEVEWLRKKHPRGKGSDQLANELASCGPKRTVVCPFDNANGGRRS
jgi:hypothetical protein